MKSYLNKRKHLLKILTVISFLLLINPGFTLFPFLFINLIFLPILMIDNGAGLVYIDQNVPLSITINLFLIASVYWAVFYLFRSGIKKWDSRKTGILCCTSILICGGFALKLNVGQPQTVFSIVSIVIFTILSLITLFIHISSNFQPGPDEF